MDSKKTITGYSGPYRGKNDYYRDGAYILMLIVNFQAIIMTLLTITLSIYLCTRHNQDRFFAETRDGNTMQMTTLSLPNMSRMTIAAWAATAASDIMTFGFNDIEIRESQSRKYFTPEGWDSFQKALTLSKIVEEIQKTQQIATTVPLSPPEPKEEGLMANGKPGWMIDVPLLITFRAGSDVEPVSKKVHMVIERMPTGENPSGVGISQWNLD